jgi:hypothetical protein
MSPLSNSLKFVAAGSFAALSFGSTPAGAAEMVQNFGPVGPNEAVLATIGSMHVIAFFEAESTQLSGTIWLQTRVNQQNAFGLL